MNSITAFLVLVMFAVACTADLFKNAGEFDSRATSFRGNQMATGNSFGKGLATGLGGSVKGSGSVDTVSNRYGNSAKSLSNMVSNAGYGGDAAASSRGSVYAGPRH